MWLYECFFVVILTNYVVIWAISKYKILTLLSISKTAKIRIESSLTYYVCWEKRKRKRKKRTFYFLNARWKGFQHTKERIVWTPDAKVIRVEVLVVGHLEPMPISDLPWCTYLWAICTYCTRFWGVCFRARVDFEYDYFTSIFVRPRW
jgi:hypothetical protein